MLIWSTDLFKPTGRIASVPLDPFWSDINTNLELQYGSYWPPKKIDFTEDTKHFPKLPSDIRQTTLGVLGYFAGSDEIVEDIIMDSPLSQIKVPEIIETYAYEAMIEKVHSRVYNNAIIAYVPEPSERDALFRAVETMPAVTAKAEWARQWINPQKSLDYTFIGKACVEGINFSSSFAWIDWLRTQKFAHGLHGLYESNDEISRDEHRHTQTSILLHKHLADKITPDNAAEIIEGSLDVEKIFVRDIIPKGGYNGMNQNMMCDHVRHCAALVANQLGYEDLYKNTSCPFPFMNLRNFDSKNNMFEKRGVEYGLAGSVQEQDAGDLDDAFKPDYPLEYRGHD
jgi:ribonucleotide reductase beta subunit family protein with ferritin-like domain